MAPATVQHRTTAQLVEVARGLVTPGRRSFLGITGSSSRARTYGWVGSWPGTAASVATRRRRGRVRRAATAGTPSS
jgi:hypothetical protein